MKKGGMSILGILFLCLILILVLSYFNISIKSVVESPTTQNNVKYVGGASESVWDKYLKKPLTDFYNDVWIKIFWASFISNMERIRDGKPTDYQLNAPQVKY